MTMNTNWLFILTLYSLANEAWGQGYLYTLPQLGVLLGEKVLTLLSTTSTKKYTVGGLCSGKSIFVWLAIDQCFFYLLGFWKLIMENAEYLETHGMAKGRMRLQVANMQREQLWPPIPPSQHIDVEIKVTTNHKGWFEFKLCENNNIHQDKDQSCFDK